VKPPAWGANEIENTRKEIAMLRKLLLAGVALLALLSPVAVTAASAHEGPRQEVRHEKVHKGHRHGGHRRHHHRHAHHGRHEKG
jgi:Spy/CpxP family protein refolding chaperone